MNMIRELCLLALLIPLTGSLSACTCLGYSHSFSLADYDRSFDVIEVRFFEVVELGVSPADYRVQISMYDSLMVAFRNLPDNKGLVPPPPPPPPPRHEVLVRGKVLQSFKGSIKTDTLLFRTSRSSGACGWIPSRGDNYIVYIGEAETKYNVEAFRLSVCQRTSGEIWSSRGEYQAEISILQSLSERKDGIIAPLETINNHEFVPFTGHFKDGKRVGLWTIFKPVFWWRDTFDQDTPVFNIKYNAGEITAVKLLWEIFPGTPRRHRRWRQWAFFYFEEKD